MTYEVEQKHHADGLEPTLRALSALGAEAGEATEQVDRYYAHPARDFAQTDEALRIRRVGEANFITYKGAKIDATTKTRREIELPLLSGADGDARFGELLHALGFKPVAEVRKWRRHARLTSAAFEVEVALDDVQGLGQFVELEISADDANLDAARSCIGALAEQLRLGANERRSYLEMLLQKVGMAAP